MYKKVLCLLDGSELAECSLGHVTSIATGCHVAEVVLLTVVEPSMATPPPFMEDWGSREAAIDVAKKMHQIDEENFNKAKEYLNNKAEILKKDGLTVETEALITELNKKVDDAVTEYAENNGIDLVIMSTHGRSGISRWAFGSVADKIIRRSSIPVLIVSPAGCRI